MWGGKSKVKQGFWGMPRGDVPTKDVPSGETLWGVASTQGSTDIRMGQPGRGNALSPTAKLGGTRGTETSKYPQEKKADAIAQVAASERVTA